MRIVVMALLGSVAVVQATASAAETWSLPVPKARVVASREDLSGVLVRMGSQVYQAKDFGLQATADGEIAISWIQGYDASGVPVRIDRKLPGSSPMGFAKIALGTDGGGYLLVGRTGSLEALTEPAYPCGLSHLSTCDSRRCSYCGSPPACACEDPSGACDPLSRDYCDGWCLYGICNQSVNDCRCVSGPGELQPAPTKAGKGAPKGQRLQPANPSH